MTISIWSIWHGVHDIISFAEITFFSRELFHQSDEVMNKMAQSTLNNCLVLQRNFEACVTAAKSNQGSKFLFIKFIEYLNT